MQDQSEQICKLCESWWDTRDISHNQKKFRKNGEYYKEGVDNLKNYWLFEINSFINTNFTYVDRDENKKSFKPKDLELFLRKRLINQLGVGIGLFFRDFEQIFGDYIFFLE